MKSMLQQVKEWQIAGQIQKLQLPKKAANKSKMMSASEYKLSYF